MRECKLKKRCKLARDVEAKERKTRRSKTRARGIWYSFNLTIASCNVSHSFYAETPQNNFLYSNEPLLRRTVVGQIKRIEERVILLLKNCHAKIPEILKRIFETFTVFQNIYSKISCRNTNNGLRNTGWEMADCCLGLSCVDNDCFCCPMIRVYDEMCSGMEPVLEWSLR